MPVNPIRVPMGEFRDKYLTRSREFIAAVNRYLKAGNKPKKAVEMAWQAVRFGEMVTDATIEGMIKGAVIGADIGAVLIGPGVFDKEFILQKWVDLDGVKFSTKLYQNQAAMKQIVANELQAQLKLGRSYKYSAQFLQDNTGQFKADIPKYLDDLYQSGRRALSGDKEALAALKDQIKQVQKQVDKLSANGTTDRLKVNYQKLINAVDSGDINAMEKRLERAIQEKARYQAERLARTEIARAYGDAKTASIQADEDATAWMWVLSSAHKDYDICDFHATADLHGIAPGCYPLDRGPDYPAHPQCTCIIWPYYKPASVRRAVDNEAAIEHLKGLSDDERRGIMGRGGAEAFNENPNSWRSQTGFKEVDKTPQIKMDI